MAQVNWETFLGLPGAADENFEKLCRAVVRRHYGQYGTFAALANQPGVEFHLKLHQACALGEPGRWYGWQCRWYGLPSGRALGTTRRNKIEEAILTTARELPDLTDWVLWTRYPLTEGDQNWFYGLTTHMQIHLWTSTELEEHLSGNAEILRGTYFGELVLTPDTLASLHREAVAPIRQRWRPEVHQTIDAERALRRMLGESNTWEDLTELADQLEAGAAAVEMDLVDLVGPLADATVKVVELSRNLATALRDMCGSLDRGDLDQLWQQQGTCPTLPLELAVLPRRLRACKYRAALTVTNALADVRLARTLFDDVYLDLSTRLIAAVADAGCGKTELAAQLTAATDDRPAGILLHGRDLHAGHSLNDLVHGVVIQGNPVRSMEALLAAVDAAGQRAHRRLPIVIDGLNEAEDPRVWKGQLASLNETLRQYPYVLVVCTLRTMFADESLPSDVALLEIPDFEQDTVEAVGRYFDYYRIDPADAELPWGLLRHPLTLRLFCEVTNPKREHVVGIEAMPGSLTAVFDRYLKQVAERVAELALRTHRYYEQDVQSALLEIGTSLWEENARSLELLALRRRLGDDNRGWHESIVRALEQDGVLLRVRGESPVASHVAVVYDALAGHLVADSVLGAQGRVGLQKWMKDPATVIAVNGPMSDQHPLAVDTFHALVGLAPRRLHGQQLWPLLDEPLKAIALRGAADLESSYLDAQTVQELGAMVVQPQTESRDLLNRLWHTRGSTTHPLNAEFLDAVLRPMSVADRDLRWTEWVRRWSKDVLADLRGLEKRWRDSTERPPADRLRAQWVMWTLTSTVREVRDQATRALYWFGRGKPSALFDLTLDSLAINDLYVPERLLAASYGVVMAHQTSEPGFEETLATYLVGLRDALTGPTAAHPTGHWLARLYVRGMVTLARAYHPDAVPEGLVANGRITFTPGPTVAPIGKEHPCYSEVKQILHMDFENYTLGRLFRNRRNYDMSHHGHQAAVAHVLGTVWDLGWRDTGLGAVDRSLAQYRSRSERARTERYGKKYGWIGFYTYAGILENDERLSEEGERLSDVDIDPSFPDPPPPAPLNMPTWALSIPPDDRQWIVHGTVTVPDELLYCPNLGPLQGPWIAVYADMNADHQAPGRRVWGILTALLVAETEADRLVQALKTRQYPGNWWLPEIPSDHYIFAGEIPWHPEFPTRNGDGDPVHLYRRLVEVENGPPIEVEILAHRYAWESYHSALNQAGGALVPSMAFSKEFDLRGIPHLFGQTQPDGSLAAVSCSAPTGFRGQLLYLREDLLYQYAAGRQFIWFIWGEREFYPYPDKVPDWLSKSRGNHEDVWRQVRRCEELSNAFAMGNSAGRGTSGG